MPPHFGSLDFDQRRQIGFAQALKSAMKFRERLRIPLGNLAAPVRRQIQQ